MGFFLRGADFFYALRFLRLLTTKWKDTTAFKLGIVDNKGKKLKKPETKEEKGAYNAFHKLVYNIKRMIGKLPFGRSTVASYAAALFLIKEHTGISEKKLLKVLKEATGCDLTDYAPDINGWYLTESNNIEEGVYTLVRDIALPKTGEVLAKRNSLVEITEHPAVGSILGHSIYKATHIKTKQMIYVTQEDITR